MVKVTHMLKIKCCGKKQILARIFKIKYEIFALILKTNFGSNFKQKLMQILNTNIIAKFKDKYWRDIEKQMLTQILKTKKLYQNLKFKFWFQS